MKNLGKTKTGGFLFECARCKCLVIYSRHTRYRCPSCGHTDNVKDVLRFGWRKRPTGYSRLITADYERRALASMRRAEALGVRFSIEKTFAGLRVTIVSIPPPDLTSQGILED